MKRVVITTLMFALVLLCSCSKNKYEKDYQDSTTVNSGDIENQITVKELDLSISQKNVNKNIAYSNEGFYYMDQYSMFSHNNGVYVYYFDYRTQKSKLWCNKIDCTHSSSGCTANLKHNEYITSMIFYNVDKIYLVSKKDDGCYLESFDKDGSNQQTLYKLWENNSLINGQYADSCIAVHRGKIYYAIGTEFEKRVIYERDLVKDAQPREISTISRGEFDMITTTQLNVVDSRLLVITWLEDSRYIPEEDRYETFNVILKFNEIDLSDDERKINLIFDSEMFTYSIHNDILYYCTYTEGFFKRDLKTGLQEFICKYECDPGMLDPESYIASTKLYLSDEYILVYQIDNAKLNVYDYNLNTVDTILLEFPDMVVGFDGRYIYATIGAMHELNIIPITDIGKEEKTFIKLQR